MNFGMPLLVAALLAPAAADSLRSYTLGPITVIGERPGRSLLPFGAARRRTDPVAAGEGIADLLSRSAGVEVVRQGGPGSPAWLGIRGSSAEQVLVLVDGVPATTSQGGGADLALLPPDRISEAQILRGPAAALWGGGALSGVVALVTAPRAVSQAAATLERGSFETTSGAFVLDEVGARSSFTVEASRARSAGDFRYDDRRRPERVPRENADFGRDDAGVHFRRESGDRAWSGDLSAVSARRGMPGTVEFPSPAAEQSDRALRARLSANPNGESPWPGRVGAEVTYLDQWRRYEDPLATWGVLSGRHHGRRAGARLSWSADEPGTHLETALEGAWESLRSTSDGDRERPSASLIARADRVLGSERSPRAHAAATLRAEAVRSFATELDPAAALSFAIVRERLDLSLAAARTHRIPSFDDLFWPASAFVTGNPQLQPERSTAVDAGARMTLPGLAASAGVFYSEVNDLIQWAPSGGARWTPHNVGHARLRGVETEVAADRPLGHRWRATALASGTWLDAVDLTSGSVTSGLRLPRRAALWGSLSLGIERGGFGARVTLDGISKRYLNAANTKWLPAHATADLAARAPLARGLSLAVEVRNVTDQAYVDVADAPVPGREWTVRLRYAHDYGGKR